MTFYSAVKDHWIWRVRHDLEDLYQAIDSYSILENYLIKLFIKCHFFSKNNNNNFLKSLLS